MKKFYLELEALGLRITSFYDRPSKKVTVLVMRTLKQEILGFAVIGNEKEHHMSQYFGDKIERCFDGISMESILDLVDKVTFLSS